MAHIKSRKHSAAPALTRSAALGLLIATTPAWAQSGATTEQKLPTISVTGSKAKADEVKVDKPSSPKLTQPLVNTTQTIGIVPKVVLEQQGAGSLMEALANTPGITMQLGEGGNTSAGDTFFMRGFSASGSIFLDGIRDLGADSRDIFNTEQVEIAKGPAGADNGRGATSGYVNLVSKQALADEFSNASLSWGSGSKKRVTGDLNRQLGDTSAFRINLMAQDGGIAARDQVEQNRFGIAPALAFGLGTGTRLHVFSQHVRQRNRPDGGVPTIGLDGYYRAPTSGNPPQPVIGAAEMNAAAAVDPQNFYGHEDDYENISTHMFTTRIEHDLGASTTVRNTSRYGRSEMERVLTGAGTVSVPAGQEANPAAWTVARSRQGVFRENEVLTNQTNVTTSLNTGSLTHDISAGVEFIYERQYSPGFVTGANGAFGSMNPANLYNPSSSDPLVNPVTLERNGTYTDGKTLTAAIYAFDTLKVSESVQFNAGLRFERYDTDYNRAYLSTANSHPALPVGTLLGEKISAADNLLSWKLGALYKPTANGSLYIAAANSQKPPGGDNFTLSSSASNINNPGMDPQEAMNLELGTKWELLNKKVLLSAAVYRSENKNELAQLDTVTNTYVQYGKKRVEGVELSAVGNINSAWAVMAGLATMKTKVLEGTATQTDAVIQWSPELTASLWTTYKIAGFTFGGGVRYVDIVKRSTSNSTAVANTPEMPSYWVTDAMASYEINKNASVQLNLYNLFDKKYMAALNNNGSRYTPGTPRSALLSANLKF